MQIRKAAAAAAVVLSSFALASCALPGLGGGDKTEGNPTPAVATPMVTSPVTPDLGPEPTVGATPTDEAMPTEEASTPAAVAGLKPMARPTKPFADPKFPKGPLRSAPFAERIAYDFKKIIWKAAGSADEKATSGTCDITDKELAKAGTKKFTCTLKYQGLSIPVNVTATGTTFISYRYTMDNLPLSRAKAEHSAMYSAYNSTAVACEMKADTVLVQVGDEQGVLCHVQDDDGEVTDYYLEMSQYGSVYGSRA